MPSNPKRQYRSRGCVRCNGYGILMVYEQSFTQHNEFTKALGAAQQFRSETTTDNLRTHAGYLHARGVPMACPSCRNLQEAATT